MKKKSLLPVLFIFGFMPCSFSQEPVGDTVVVAFDDYPDSTVYSAMRQILNANLPVSYVTIPMIGQNIKAVERIQPLTLGEGQKGYILEGITDLNFILVQGRGMSNHGWQTQRTLFRYAPGVRMTRDNSSNLVPTNQKVGLHFDKILWDNYTNIKMWDNKGNTRRFLDSNWNRSTRVFHMVYISLLAMHYSNGQAEGVYRSAADSIVGRNDYIKGDFSTNILQAALTWSRYNRHKDLLSVNMGYQHDGNWFGPFYFIPQQKKRYGQDRIVGYLQWRTRPLRHPFGATTGIWDAKNKKAYKIDNKWEYRFRFDYEYIMGDLSLFKRSKEYRFNWHLFLEGMPLRSRSVGYMIHFYRGRDYFNIRYDDIVFAFSFGITFTIHRYRNPKFRPQEAVIGTLNGNQTKFDQRQQKARLK